MRLYDIPIRISVNPKPIRSRGLEKKLVSYISAGTAAGICVAAAAQPAAAKVVVTHTNKTIDFQKQTKLDLNNDGIPDFGFSFEFQFCCETNVVIAPFKFNQVLGAYSASALSSGVTVGKGDKFAGHVAVMQWAFQNRTSGTTNYGGKWLNATDRYLGLAFRINGQPHFGWARLTFTGFGAATLTEYAYETIPGKAIVTGGASDEESSAEAASGTSAATESVGRGLGVLAAGAAGLDRWRK